MQKLQGNKKVLSETIKSIMKVDCAIISAMPEELEFVEQKLSYSAHNLIVADNFKFKLYEFKGKKIITAHSGIGLGFAASLLTFIHLNFKPSHVFIIGTAGGINHQVKLCDVVIAEKSFETEMQTVFSMVKNTPFENCLKHPLKKAYFPSQFSASSDLLNLCKNLSVPNTTIFCATVASSNTFPAPKELFSIIKSLNAYAIDMETSAFYQTAWLLGINILSIRGISNLLQHDGTDDNLKSSDITGSTQAATATLFAILEKLISQDNSITTFELDPEAAMLIKKYKMEKHVEGGYFVSTYKSDQHVKPLNKKNYNHESRSAGSAIYYLLNKNDFSAWHSLKSDETWHYYYGSPIILYIINQAGLLTQQILGNPFIHADAHFQVHIKAGDYFAAELLDKSSFCFAGCTVSPGFEYADFELCEIESLITQFPQHESIIQRLGR